ncbi:MAG: TfoX/Sxy family protein [Alphaproteobacteria bacterium]|nr:TfoX/Sxy family protein [Alphaproteobacteria bacterium]
MSKKLDQNLNQLQPLGHPSKKTMFGGLGLYLDGVIFGIVVDNKIYLKVNDENIEKFKKAKSHPFTYDKNGKSVSMSYWAVPQTILKNPKEWQAWVQESWNISKKSKKK